MANPEHVALLKQGVRAWNAFRKAFPAVAIDLSEVSVSGMDLRGADLGAKEAPVNLCRSDFSSAQLLGANLAKAELVGANLSNADLSKAYMTGAYLRSADLTKTNLNGARLFKALLSRATLTGAVLSGVDLGRADCEYANLQQAVMVGADLTDANFDGANLQRADVTEAKLHRTSLLQANIDHARLREASLKGTKFDDADLRSADLVGADFNDATVCRANLSYAELGWTTISSVDLSSAHGLETVVHRGPSTVGIDTIYKSAGNIPHAFLIGAGISDNFIAYMASLVGKPFEYYSCFISYSTLDQPFAERLHADLQAKGVRCWFAPHDITGGKKIHQQIDEAIRLHEKLLLILSPASMKSDWVETEIAKARRREKREDKQVLFPVRLVDFQAIRDWECFDADAGKDSAREIREYFIPDFSTWETDHRAYQKALDQLLKGLQSKAGTAPTP